MAKRDFYETLGIQKGADADAIKKAYRQKAKELHPDRNSGNPKAEDQFKEANEAYEVLKNADKKAAYDRYGHAAFEGGMGGGGQQRGGGQGDFGSAFSDVFDDLFGNFGGGGGQQRSRAQRGNDLRYNLRINLEDAFSGLQKTVNIPAAVACGPCNGTGAEDGSQPVTTCHGQGRVEKEKALSVNIPSGVETGTRIRLSGEGEAGMRGGPTGDLYIFIEVNDHKLFERDNVNLYCTVPVSIASAALGGEIEVPTIDGGRSRVKIPEGSQSGRQMRLRAKGMPALRGNGTGDMFIELAVETPVNLTTRQKELLQEFDEIQAENNPNSSNFFKSVKSFWDSMKG